MTSHRNANLRLGLNSLIDLEGPVRSSSFFDATNDEWGADTTLLFLESWCTFSVCVFVEGIRVPTAIGGDSDAN
jgi:hypothetical protein